MTHKWYSGFDWEGLFHRKLKEKDIPINPVVKDPEDASMFEPWDKSMRMNDPEVKWTPELPDMYSKHVEREASRKDVGRGGFEDKGLLDTIKDMETMRAEDKITEEREGSPIV